MQSQKNPALEVAHLYIVENTLGLVKIGIAGNPAKRIKSLEANSGLPITRRHISPPCLRCREMETALHKQFAEKRQAGEWFDLLFDDAVAALETLQAQPAAPPSQAVTPFDFRGHAVRTVNQDGETWFVARDVCECLDLENVSMALARLRDTEKLTSKILMSGQNRDAWLVNEPGLYRLIFTSNKAEAQAFQDWVYHDVLPAIRNTGSYATHPHGQITPEIQAIIQASVKAEFTALYDKLGSASKSIAKRFEEAETVIDTTAISNTETIQAFILDCCQRVGHNQCTKTLTLYNAYQAWAVARGELAMLTRHFGQALNQLGYQKVRRGSGYWRRGIALRSGGAS